MANVLDPYFMTEVVQNIRTDINLFRGAQILTGGVDLKEELGLTIEYDVTYDEVGMTPPTGLNDESPIREKQIVAHMNFTNQEWREKKIIDREKIEKLRAPGSRLEQRWAENYMIESLTELNTRLETRFEWMRWTCLKGSLLVPKTENKPAYTIDYKVPNKNKPTAAVLWSDPNSDPLADIKAWKLLFRGSGARPKKIIVNEKVDGYLMKNNTIRELMRTQYGFEMVTAGNLETVLRKELGGMTYEVYDEGYMDDDGNFFPYVPDNACIIVGEGMTGNMIDLATSPNNYTDLFKGETGKFALTKLISGDPDYWIAVNGATVLPKLRHVDWHVFATVA